MPWKLKHFNRSSVTEKGLHLITTLLAPNQHSLAKRGSGTSGAKPNQYWLQVHQGPWPSGAHSSWNLSSEEMLWPKGNCPTISTLSGRQRAYKSGGTGSWQPVFWGALHTTCHAHGYLTAISAAVVLGTGIQLPLGQVRVKLWDC